MASPASGRHLALLLTIGFLSIILLPAPAAAYGGGGQPPEAMLQRENVRRKAVRRSPREPAVPKRKSVSRQPKGGGQPAASSAASQSAGTMSASIKGFAFSPAKLTVKKGTTVTWKNLDSVVHTVTGEDGRGPQSGRLSKGDSFSHVFLEEGTFPYFCTPHPYMRGAVEVLP